MAYNEARQRRLKRNRYFTWRNVSIAAILTITVAIAIQYSTSSPQPATIQDALETPQISQTLPTSQTSQTLQTQESKTSSNEVEFDFTRHIQEQTDLARDITGPMRDIGNQLEQISDQLTGCEEVYTDSFEVRNRVSRAKVGWTTSTHDWEMYVAKVSETNRRDMIWAQSLVHKAAIVRICSEKPEGSPSHMIDDIDCSLAGSRKALDPIVDEFDKGFKLQSEIDDELSKEATALRTGWEIPAAYSNDMMDIVKNDLNNVREVCYTWNPWPSDAQRVPWGFCKLDYTSHEKYLEEVIIVPNNSVIVTNQAQTFLLKQEELRQYRTQARTEIDIPMQDMLKLKSEDPKEVVRLVLNALERRLGDHLKSLLAYEPHSSVDVTQSTSHSLTANGSSMASASMSTSSVLTQVKLLEHYCRLSPKARKTEMCK